MQRPVQIWAWGVAAALAVVHLGCSAEAPETAVGPAPPAIAARDLAAPVAERSLAPSLRASQGELLLTWIERIDAEGEERAHRVRFARWTDGEWSAPSTLTQGTDVFANWADRPGVVRGGDGALYAHWLAETGAEKYAYSAFAGRSVDGGATWEALGLLPDDDSPTEHGFVSWVPEGEGARAFWLDGRQWVEDGPMSLRTAYVSAAGIEASEAVDTRVCDCCPTSAALVAGRPVVVYRDRSPQEVRDIRRVSREADGWSEPEPVGNDEWRIEGCPVNGPRIAASGERSAVAWFTAAGGEAAVRLSFGDSESVRVDEGNPIGRVDLVLGEGGAWVVWLEARDERAEVRLRWVGEGGELGESRVVAETSPARASGFPRLAALDGRLVLAWVEIADAESPSRVRVTDVGAA